MKPYVSVIFTTYNQPDWLKWVLTGFNCQTYKDFEVIIADDGSKDETRRVIERFKKDSTYPIKHVWIEDKGFRKCNILNLAIEKSQGEYLIFTDGDCIPRKDFIETHLKYKSPRHFLSGGAARLPMNLSKAITGEDILSGRIFSNRYLSKMIPGQKYFSLKLIKNRFITTVINTLTPCKPTWNGNNASCYREHVLAANGMDERMKYGGEDCELGERLTNMGVTGKLIRHKAASIHLDHPRGYVRQEHIRRNEAIREKTRKEKHTWTEFGILKEDKSPSYLLKASYDRYNSEDNRNNIDSKGSEGKDFSDEALAGMS